jgi:hypothetical protein
MTQSRTVTGPSSQDFVRGSGVGSFYGRQATNLGAVVFSCRDKGSKFSTSEK